MENRIQHKIDSAVQVWQRYWGDSLQSIILYGSAARDEWSAKSSDINLLLLLNEPGYDRWPGAADLARRRLGKGFALPLLMSEEYIRSSLDVFPIEFLDLKHAHVVLYGSDPFTDLEIAPEHLRLQAEREVKGKWVQLREAALERGGNTVAMRDLLALTVPTWRFVFLALIAIQGEPIPPTRQEILRRGSEIAGVDTDLFLTLDRVKRERTALNRTDTWNLLKRCLEQVDQLARFVDGWNRSR